MSTLLQAASSAAQSIIKNIVQNNIDDDSKLDEDYDPSNALDQKQAAKDKIEDSFAYDDEKDIEEEFVEAEEVLSDVSDVVEEEEDDDEVTETAYPSQESEALGYMDESVSAELELALENVRRLASFHQETLVNSICERYSSFNGQEPTINDLVAIFGRIKRSLAEEAAEDESDANDEEYDNESDSDYSPEDGEDNLQYLKDVEDDCREESEYESDASDESDSDYDPNDADDLNQAKNDLEDDNADSDGDLFMESVGNIDYAEDRVINSENFDEEYFSAIEAARERAKRDKQAILQKIKEEYVDIFGEAATNEIISEAFQPFVSSADEEVSEEQVNDEEADDYDDEDFEEYDEEEPVNPSDMESALNNVRRLAKQHQSKFVEDILSTFNSKFGFEPSVDDLSVIFNEVKHRFADETRNDFLDQADNEEEKSD